MFLISQVTLYRITQTRNPVSNFAQDRNRIGKNCFAVSISAHAPNRITQTHNPVSKFPRDPIQDWPKLHSCFNNRQEPYAGTRNITFLFPISRSTLYIIAKTAIPVSHTALLPPHPCAKPPYSPENPATPIRQSQTYPHIARIQS